MSTMFIRLSNKYISNLELSRPIVDNRQKTQSMFSTVAISGIPKPQIYDGWFLSGSLKQSDEDCGKWLRLGCLNSHNDNLLQMDHGMLKRNVFVKPFKRMCNRLGCAVCFIKSGIKKSLEIKKRLDLYTKYYGNNYPIHVIVSPRPNTSLDYLTMRKLVNKRLKTLGLRGWVLIPHPFRVCREYETVQKNEGLVSFNGANQEPVSMSNPPLSNRGFDKLGFHFHAVGYGWIDGKKQAKLFDDEKEEKLFVLNTKNKNRNVRKTIQYLLSHCGVRDDRKYHSITYNGSLGYSNRCLSKSRWSYGLDGKLHKDGYEKKEDKINKNECPICKEPLRMLEYVGTDRPPDIEDSYFDESDKWKYSKEPIRNSTLWFQHLL